MDLNSLQNIQGRRASWFVVRDLPLSADRNLIRFDAPGSNFQEYTCLKTVS